MSLVKILVLAVVQGAAELLPVSSSAHVIVAEKLMGLDPTAPEMTLLLVMLHTGTMFAVIFYFWGSWRTGYFSSRERFLSAAKLIAAATFFTGVVGLVLKALIEKVALRGTPHAQVELIFGNVPLIAASLFAVGLLIVYSGGRDGRAGQADPDLRGASLIGLIQGVCLPFRGFSRSGATISAGLMQGISRKSAEEFSFALAVVLTPPVIAREVWRLLKAHAVSPPHAAFSAALFLPGLLAMVFSFISGILALKWLSNWMEKGRWRLFGYYCLSASLLLLIFNEAGLLK